MVTYLLLIMIVKNALNTKKIVLQMHLRLILLKNAKNAR